MAYFLEGLAQPRNDKTQKLRFRLIIVLVNNENKL